jgi:hypothetical protein
MAGLFRVLAARVSGNALAKQEAKRAGASDKGPLHPRIENREPGGSRIDTRRLPAGPRRKERRGKWCSGGDLNPHAFRHTPLKRTCLPFHHPSRVRKNEAGTQESKKGILFILMSLLMILLELIRHGDRAP